MYIHNILTVAKPNICSRSFIEIRQHIYFFVVFNYPHITWYLQPPSFTLYIKIDQER